MKVFKALFNEAEHDDQRLVLAMKAIRQDCSLSAESLRVGMDVFPDELLEELAQSQNATDFESDVNRAMRWGWLSLEHAVESALHNHLNAIVRKAEAENEGKAHLIRAEFDRLRHELDWSDLVKQVCTLGKIKSPLPQPFDIDAPLKTYG